MRPAVVAKASSLLLRYPSAEALAALPLVREVVRGGPLQELADYRSTMEPLALQAEYVELFDLRRQCCLYLTFYTDGDTRNRGMALVRFAEAFRGYRILDGELPDYLPAVLELAAVDQEGWSLIREHRVGLDLLAKALQGSVYRHGVEAVLSNIPKPSRRDELAALALARSGPPSEEVGR